MIVNNQRIYTRIVNNSLPANAGLKQTSCFNYHRQIYTLITLSKRYIAYDNYGTDRPKRFISNHIYDVASII